MLQKELDNILLAFNQEFQAKLVQVANEVAKECARDIKNSANQAFPKGVNYSTGEYARSWTASKVKNGNRETVSCVVHATSPYYRLTHLLENGHRIVDRNGQVHGFKEGKPHIQPIAERYEEEFERRMELL